MKLIERARNAHERIMILIMRMVAPERDEFVERNDKFSQFTAAFVVGFPVYIRGAERV